MMLSKAVALYEEMPERNQGQSGPLVTWFTAASSLLE